MKNPIKFIMYWCFAILLMVIALIGKKKREELIWGPIPIINNRYWSEALRQVGYKSRTLMINYYSVNNKADFDLYYDDLTPGFIFPRLLREFLKPIFAELYILRNAKVVHIPFSGGPLGFTPIAHIEHFLWKCAGIKVVVLPYGADSLQYSRVFDNSLRCGLLTNYPLAARQENFIRYNVEYWTKRADIVIIGFMMDITGRWDCTLYSWLSIDEKLWDSNRKYSINDGTNDVVKIMHAPNHRGIKGTEFIVQAVQELLDDGLKIELVLLENVPNVYIREKMEEVDILVEQLILGYGLNAIEGMASGLPVMSNMENEDYTRVFRRYSYLNECPILSTSPENIKENLRILIRNPELRRKLGQAGRKYVEKYHSYAAAQYLFKSIYDKIIGSKDIDLMNLFHPLKSSYNRSKPYVEHPLVENKLPPGYFSKCLED